MPTEAEMLAQRVQASLRPNPALDRRRPAAVAALRAFLPQKQQTVRLAGTQIPQGDLNTLFAKARTS